MLSPVAQGGSHDLSQVFSPMVFVVGTGQELALALAKCCHCWQLVVAQVFVVRDRPSWR